MSSPAVGVYEFDGFRLDVAGRRLRKADGTAIELSARAFDVLLYLVENPGEDISKERLTNAAWPTTVVDENNLNQAISGLRRALADERSKPRYIMTVAGRGYRFVAPVNGQSTAPPTQRWKYAPWIGVALIAAVVAFVVFRPANAPPTVAVSSVAVLPFHAIVREQSNPALELGMAEAIIARLSELPGITVRPLGTVSGHTSAAEDPIAVGRALGVTAVLEGTLQTENDGVRVTSRLLRVSDGRALWSGRFDEKASGIFQVQDSIATQVMQTLAEQLGTRAPPLRVQRTTLNPEAYQLYASGIFNWQRRDIDGTDAAVADFKGAIRADAGYARAWSALASVLCAQSAFGIKTPQSVLPEAKLAAQRAIELDAELPEAQAVMGQVLVQYERKYAEGERYYRRALELNPNLGIARLWASIDYLYLGRADEALAQARRAQELEPLNLAFSANVGRSLYFARQYDAAITHLNRVLLLVPNFDDARSLVGRSLLQQRKFDAALAQFNGRRKSSPGSFGDVGRAYAMSGKAAEAHAEIEKLRAKGAEGFGVSYDIAGIHALLGEAEPACEALRHAMQDYSQLVGFLHLDPDFDSVRSQACVREVTRLLKT